MAGGLTFAKLGSNPSTHLSLGMGPRGWAKAMAAPPAHARRNVPVYFIVRYQTS